MALFCVPLCQYDGLGNKLKAFIGSLSINKNTKIQSSDQIPYSRFSSIFPREYIHDQNEEPEYLPYYTSRFPVLKSEEDEQEDLINEFSSHYFDAGKLNYLFSQKHIDWYYDKKRLSPALINRILNAIHSLHFLPHIYEQVEKQAVFTGITLAVGIRTWKALHEHNIDRPYNSSIYQNKITSVLEQHPEIENIFVTIDNDQFIGEYMAYFKTLHQKIYYFKRLSRFCDVEDALIQVLISSKCQYLIGNRISSFTELIWWFSYLNIQVDTVF